MVRMYNGVVLPEVHVAKIIEGDETKGGEVVLDTGGSTTLEVYFRGDVATTVQMDVSDDGENWVEGYELWSGYTEVKEGYLTGFRYVRVKVSGAGQAGDKFTLVVTAK